MRPARTRAVEGRNDLSRFVMHLTRDDTDDAGEDFYEQSAEENFRGILDSGKVLALRCYWLHGNVCLC